MGTEKKTFYMHKISNLFNIRKIVTVHYQALEKNYLFPEEEHDFWEINYADKEDVFIGVSGTRIQLKQGEILFHAPNEFHAVRALNSAPNLFVISFNCVSPAMARFVRYQTTLDKTLKTYLSAIIREADKTYIIPKNDPDLKKLKLRSDALVGGEQLIKTYLEQFLIFLLRSITVTTPPSFPQKDAQNDPLVERIHQYLLAHLDQVIRIEDLCREFDYSRSYLNRRFQAKTGQSLAAYAMGLKIGEAKRLIRETELNFAQISARLAFENPQYFSRVFKEKTGMTPTEFKKRAHV